MKMLTNISVYVVALFICNGIYAGFAEVMPQAHDAAIALIDANMNEALRTMQQAQHIVDLTQKIEHMGQAANSLHAILTPAGQSATQVAEGIQAMPRLLGNKGEMGRPQATSAGHQEMQKITETLGKFHTALLQQAETRKIQEAVQKVDQEARKAVMAIERAQAATDLNEKLKAAQEAQKSIGIALSSGLNKLHNK